MAMSDAQLMHAERMARGEESYQGKLLEARAQTITRTKSSFAFSAPIIVLAWGVWSDDPAMMEKIDVFFSSFWLDCRYGSKLCGLPS